jgi:hypothetical protein
MCLAGRLAVYGLVCHFTNIVNSGIISLPEARISYVVDSKSPLHIWPISRISVVLEILQSVLEASRGFD